MKMNLKNKYNNMLLRHKISVLLIVTLAVQVIFGIVINFTVVRSTFSKNSITYTNDVLYNLKLNIEGKMNNVENISQNIIYNETINNVLEENISAEMEFEAYETQKTVNTLLKSLSFPQDDIQTVVLYNNGGYAYVMDINNDFSKADESMYEYVKSCTSAAPEWRFYNDGIVLLREIRNKNSMAQIGKMIILLKDNAFSGLFANMHNNQQFGIIFDGGVPMSFSEPDAFSGIDRDIYTEYLSSRNGHYINRKTDELVCFVALKNTGWNVVSSIPLKVLYKDMNYVNGYILLFGMIACAVLFAINRIFADSVEKPIAGLVKKIEKFKHENVLDTVEYCGNDEIGYLERNFNEMAQHLKTAVQNVYLERISRKNAYIKALQAQINPHFIYNTLESISWTARRNNDAAVGDMIHTLAVLMEVNFRKKEKIISIEEEISYIKEYYKIIKFRFGDSVEFRYDIESGTEKVKIPSLLIQPLAENSVNHGVGNASGKGIICIKSYREGENVIIEVIDNGAGIPEEKLEEINDLLEKNPYDGMEETESIGIVNTGNRIKLYYGDEYGLKIFTRKGCYCKIRITIADNLTEV